MIVEQTEYPAPPMSALEWETWRAFLAGRCGLGFAADPGQVLRRGLWRRMRALGIRSYNEYHQMVAYGAGGGGEWAELLEQVLNHETCFFRHAPSFEALTRHVLPELLADRRRDPGLLSLWSAGCSRGQEAYSLLLAASEHGDAAGWRVLVYGTDISPAAVEQARLGRYPARELERLPQRYRAKHFARSARREEYEVKPHLRPGVKFATGNLNDPKTLPILQMHVIFCQNVLIYFNADRRVEIVRDLAERLVPGGYLFLGPTEAVGLRAPGLEPVQLGDVVVHRRH